MKKYIVSILGILAGVGILLYLFVPHQSEAPAPEGDTPQQGKEVAVEWTEAVSIIESCNAAMIMQTHANLVFINKKDGTRVVATEPNIDDVFAIAQAAGAKCGVIPLATE